jgi:hypothetical protein
MAKYDKKSQDNVRQTMHEHKHEGKFKNRKQAIAAGLSMARKEGSKAPEK